jgi:hypothetical protein
MFQRPSLPPSSGNDVMGVFCVLLVYIYAYMYGPWPVEWFLYLHCFHQFVPALWNVYSANVSLLVYNKRFHLSSRSFCSLLNNQFAMFFSVMLPCRVIAIPTLQRNILTASFIFSLEDGDSIFLQNGGTYLWVYMALQPRWTQLSSSFPCEPQISLFF